MEEARPGCQVAGSAFPTANHQPLPPVMGRDAMTSHPSGFRADAMETILA
jgi:hypothetical protein